MIKKLTALCLSVLSLGFGFMSNSFAFGKSSGEERDVKIQKQEMLKHKTKSFSYKIKQTEIKIEHTENKIKRLEMKKSSFDYELSVALQLKEGNLDLFESRKLQKEIYKITVKKDLNEEKIKKLKEKRNNLDYELAVLFQLQEISNDYDF